MTTPIVKIKGIGLHSAEILTENGFKSVEDLAETTEETLGKLHGFGPARAKKVIKAARALCNAKSDTEVSSPSLVVTTETPETTEDLIIDDAKKAEDSLEIKRLEKKDKSKKKSKKTKKKKNKEDEKTEIEIEKEKEKKQKKTKKSKKTSDKKKEKEKKKKKQK
jgi:hypothetical protein